MRRRPEVALRRQYAVLTTEGARRIARARLRDFQLQAAVEFGLPEVDDRQHVWRVPLVSRDTEARVGEIVIDAMTTLVLDEKSTSRETLEARLLHRKREGRRPASSAVRSPVVLSALRNTIALGDSAEILLDLPAQSVDLVFTSPPYYNARPEYTDYVSYEDYLLQLRKVIQQCHRVLSEGRMFVINLAPVLIRRQSRNHSSKRIAVPFDAHRLFVEEGFEFIDDIIWMKPEGAGWATGRGRRFAADRNPMQYKTVPVTEYVLVYRKATDRLIDWHIRSHPSPSVVVRSRIPEGYERTNVWRIKPAHSAKHPAIFPDELVARVIQYYSFVGDVVLDPFAGIGTVGAVATRMDRRWVLVEKDPKYVEIIRKEAVKWLGRRASDVFCIGCGPLDGSGALF